MTTPPDPTTTPSPDPVPRRHAYTFPEGVMYATIWPAKRDRDTILPGIEVTSRSSTNSAAEASALLKVGGREYGVAELYRQVTARPGAGRAVYRWQLDTFGYRGGYLNSNGKPLDHRASTWFRLKEIAKATLAQFTADVPQWRQESLRLLLLREWVTAQEMVTRLDAMLHGAQAEVRQAYAALHHTAADAGAEVVS